MKKSISILFTFLMFMTVSFGCNGNIGVIDKGKEPNKDDIGLTDAEAMSHKDFIGPDNVPAAKKDIFIGIKSKTKVFDSCSDVEYYILALKNQKKDIKIIVTLKSKFSNYITTNTHNIKASEHVQRIAGKIKAEKNGILEFNIKMEDSSGKAIMDKTKNIGVMEVAYAPSDDKFMWGVQPFLTRAIDYNEGLNGAHCFDGTTAEETYNLIFDYISKTGANVIRDGSIWETNQPAKTVFDFKMMDRLLKDIESKGYILDWAMGGTPNWAVEPRFASADVKWNKPPTVEAWASYITKVADRYANKKSLIMEIINECNWPDFFFGKADEYKALLNKSMEIIKAKDISMPVINGGMVMPQANNFTNEASEDFKFEEDHIYYGLYGELIATKKMPYVAYHSHAWFKDFIEKDSVNLMYSLKDNKIATNKAFLNESGAFSADGAAQVDPIIKKALYAKCNDQQGFVLFNFRDIDGGILSPPGWGVITKDGQPKETYVAYATAINHLSNFKNKKTYANTLYNAYLMDNEIKSTLVLFKDKSVIDGIVTLPANMKFTAYDMFGNIVTDGYNKISDNPIYIEFESKIDPSQISISLPNGSKKMLSEYERVINF